jgi:hypothetical protein
MSKSNWPILVSAFVFGGALAIVGLLFVAICCGVWPSVSDLEHVGELGTLGGMLTFTSAFRLLFR